MTKIDLKTQTQGILPKLSGGTGTTFGGATEMLLLPFVNDSGGALTRHSLVCRTAASGILQWTSTAGQAIIGVIAGRYNTTTGDFEDADPDVDETAAVCVAGRIPVLVTTTADRWDYLRASSTTGTAEPNTTILPGTFGIVLYNMGSGLAQALISGSSGGSGGVTDHGALTGLADDDHSAYVTVTGGGGETISTVGATGGTETVDLADGNVHDLTLTADCSLTLTGATASVACSLTLLLRQDGTGGWDATWPGSVEWPGGVTPTLDGTPSAVDVFTLFTVDGGTVWFGFHSTSTLTYATPAIVLGTAASAGAADSVIRSDATIVAFDATAPVTQAFGDAAATGSAAVAARRDHRHGMPAEPAGGSGGHLLISDTHSTPLVFDDILQNDDGTDFLYSDT